MSSRSPTTPPPGLPSKHWSLKVQRAVKTSGVKVPKANNLRTETGFSLRGWWWLRSIGLYQMLIIYHLCLHTAWHSGSRMIDPPKKNRSMIGIVKKNSNHLTSAWTPYHLAHKFRCSLGGFCWIKAPIIIHRRHPGRRRSTQTIL